MSRARLISAALLGLAAAGAGLAEAQPGAGPLGGLNAPGIRAKVLKIPVPGDRPVLAPDAAPPDPTGAVNSGYFVQATNGHIAVFARKGVRRIAETTLSRFLGAGNFQTGDPQITWDPGAGRWLFAAHGLQTNKLYYGWSKGGDPSHLRRGWCKFDLPQGRLLPDFPRLGFSSGLILIGLNMADKNAGEVPFARLVAIAAPPRSTRECRRRKVTTFGGPKHPLRGADGRRAGTPVPVMSHAPSGRGWVVSAQCINEDPPVPEQEDCSSPLTKGTQLTVWHLGGPPGAPSLIRDGAVPVPVFRPSPPIPQPGTRAQIDASDARLTQAISETDPSFGGVEALWTAHTVGAGGGRSAVRWYEIDPQALSLLRTGLIASPRFSTAYGAVSPTARGDSAAVNYILAGKRLRVQIRARFRGPRDPPGTMMRTVVLARSPGVIPPTEDCFDRPPVCRYGDYNAMVPDPARASAVWGTNELTGPPDPRKPRFPAWRTRIFAIASPPNP